MNVSITIVRAIVDELQRRGLSSAAFSAHAEIDLAELADATSRITVERYERAAAAALSLSGDPAIGLHAAWSAPAGALHVVGHLLVNCGSMRDAIEQFFHFAPLILEGTRWRLREEDLEAHFVYEQQSVTDAEHARFDAEFCMALVLKLGYQLIGTEKPPRAVCFRHAAPPYAETYERVFKCPVLFAQPHNEIAFKRKYLDLLQTHRDESVRDLLRKRAEDLLAQFGSDDRLAERVVDLLSTGTEVGKLDIAALARKLGTTPRSLQRRLRERGLSPTTLLETARRDVACRALRANGSSIKDVAYRLGFSEPSAFHRAFKRWTGVTPAEYKRGVPDALRSGVHLRTTEEEAEDAVPGEDRSAR
jgi:AraC-like DNA-binding protein